MGNAPFLAVDLPPVPHPGMILDYTVMPVVDAFGKDVRLFPLIVSTPDHNVTDIALRGFAKIAEYFEQNGVPKGRIHPIFVLNKVPLEEAVTYEVSKKFAKIGVLYLCPQDTSSKLNHVNRYFDYE